MGKKKNTEKLSVERYPNSHIRKTSYTWMCYVQNTSRACFLKSHICSNSSEA